MSESTDHDLLVQLHEQVKNINIAIQDLKDGNSAKILDHEIRIRRLEYFWALAVGGLAALQLVLKYLVK